MWALKTFAEESYGPKCKKNVKIYSLSVEHCTSSSENLFLDLMSQLQY